MGTKAGSADRLRLYPCRLNLKPQVTLGNLCCMMTAMVRPVSRVLRLGCGVLAFCFQVLVPCGLPWGLGPGQRLGDDPYHGLAALGALHVQRELPRRAGFLYQVSEILGTFFPSPFHICLDVFGRMEGLSEKF